MSSSSRPLRTALRLAPSGRGGKTTESIVSKLKRGSVKLDKIQDIAGCRVVLEDIKAQDEAVERIRQLFPGCRIVDRRLAPSHGYRAVHVIPIVLEHSIEIQLRTRLQHEWAQLSEKQADRCGVQLKYGGGPPRIREFLETTSEIVKDLELDELRLRSLPYGAERERRVLDLERQKHSWADLLRYLQVQPPDF